MLFMWDESLATGSATIDRQHRRLIAQVTGLADAMKQGKGRQEIEAVLDHLGQYVVEHFAEEEKLMDELKCPAAAVNKRAHTQFLKKYGELKTRFEHAGAGPTLVLEMYGVLSTWLLEHIQGIDLQLRDQTGHVEGNLIRAAR